MNHVRPDSAPVIRPVRRALALTITLFAGALGACSDDTDETKPEASASPNSGAAWAAPYTEIAQQVAIGRGLRWDRQVGVVVNSPGKPYGSDGSTPAEATGRWAGNARFALAALGLISKEEALDATWVKAGLPVQPYEFAGRFHKGNIEINDDGTISPADLRIVAHEMVRALDDQQMRSAVTPPRVAEEHQVVRLLQVEGNATLGERDYMASLGPDAHDALTDDTVFPGYPFAVDDGAQIVHHRSLPAAVGPLYLANRGAPAAGIRALQELKSDRVRNDLVISPRLAQAALLSPARLGSEEVDVAPALDATFEYRGFRNWQPSHELSAIHLAAAMGVLDDPAAALTMIDAFAGMTTFQSEGSPCVLLRLNLTGDKTGEVTRSLTELAKSRGGESVPGHRFTYSLCGEGKPLTEDQVAAAASPVMYRLVIFAELLHAGIKSNRAAEVAQEFAIDKKLADDRWNVMIGWPADPDIVTRAVTSAVIR
jgi:hypothetical protein